jgi:hypothetical protein
VRFPCVHAVATTPAQRLGVLLRSFTPPYQPSPITLSGRPARRPFRGLLGVHLRYGLHTRAATVYRDTLSGGFSHFVTSMTAPVASGWSDCRVGVAPTGKRRLSTAHERSGHGSISVATRTMLWTALALWHRGAETFARGQGEETGYFDGVFAGLQSGAAHLGMVSGGLLGHHRFVALAIWLPGQGLAKTCAALSDLEFGPDGCQRPILHDCSTRRS